MATIKQTRTVRRNISEAQQAVVSKRSIAHIPKETRTALGKQGAAVAQRKRTGGISAVVGLTDRTVQAIVAGGPSELRRRSHRTA